jgi:hypothetical protein
MADILGGGNVSPVKKLSIRPRRSIDRSKKIGMRGRSEGAGKNGAEGRGGDWVSTREE